MGEKIARIIKGATFALLYILIYNAMQFLAGFEILALGSDAVNAEGVAAIVSAAASFVIFMVILYLRGIDRRKVFRISRPKFFEIVFAATLAVGFRILTSAYMIWAENVDILKKSMENAEAAFDYDTMTGAAMFALILAILASAPIFEEILFRGMVLGELRRVMPAPLAILIQGILFGIAHLVLIQGIFAAVFGVILGYIYYRTKKLSVTMIAHFVFNLSSVFEINGSGGLGWVFFAGALITVVSILMFNLLYREKKKLSEEYNNG